MRKPLSLGLLAALVRLALWPHLLPPPDDTDRIAGVLDAVTTALENRDAGDVMEHLAPEYHDAHGLRFHDIYRYLAAEFLRHRRIVIKRLGPRTIEVRPDRTATASFTVLASEGLRLEALRRLGIWDVTVALREIEGEWKITGHRRTPRRGGSP